MLRAYRICDPTFLKQEINFIFSAFSRVGFPRHVLHSVHSNVKRKFFQTNRPSLSQTAATEEPSVQKPTIVLPHNRFISQYVKPVFRENDYRVVNKAHNTIRNSLVRNKPPRSADVGVTPGVYSIPCHNCPSMYYGESGRGLNVRLGEHKNAVSRREKNNALYKHKIDCFEKEGVMHQINWEGSKLLHVNHNWNNRLAVESSYIKSFPNFNGMKSTLGIDKFSAKLVLDSIPKLHPLPP